jgi:hypothetical protein
MKYLRMYPHLLKLKSSRLIQLINYSFDKQVLKLPSYY